VAQEYTQDHELYEGCDVVTRAQGSGSCVFADGSVGRLKSGKGSGGWRCWAMLERRRGLKPRRQMERHSKGNGAFNMGFLQALIVRMLGLSILTGGYRVSFLLVPIIGRLRSRNRDPVGPGPQGCVRLCACARNKPSSVTDWRLVDSACCLWSERLRRQRMQWRVCT
jgi:hypothetical protein